MDSLGLGIALVLILGVAVVLIQEQSFSALASSAHSPVTQTTSTIGPLADAYASDNDVVAASADSDNKDKAALSIIDSETFNVTTILLDFDSLKLPTLPLAVPSSKSNIHDIELHKGNKKVFAYVKSITADSSGKKPASTIYKVDLKGASAVKKVWAEDFVPDVEETPNGKYLFIMAVSGVNQQPTYNVRIFDTSTDALIQTIPLQVGGGTVIYDRLVFSHDSKWAYVLQAGEYKISVIDIDGLLKVKEISYAPAVIFNPLHFMSEALGSDVYSSVPSVTGGITGCKVHYASALTSASGEYALQIKCPVDTELGGTPPYFSGFMALSTNEEIAGQDAGSVELMNLSAVYPTGHCTIPTPNASTGSYNAAVGLAFSPDNQYLYYVTSTQFQQDQFVEVYTTNCTVTNTVPFPQGHFLASAKTVLTLDGKYYAYMTLSGGKSFAAFVNTSTHNIDKIVPLPYSQAVDLAVIGDPKASN